MTKKKTGKLNKGGRPKKYTPAFLDIEAEALLQFIELCFQTNSVPFECTFALQRGYSSQRFSEKDFKEHPRFSEAFKRFKDVQKSVLLSGGLSGHLQTGFAIFTCKNVLGWRDRQEVEHSGQIDTPIRINYEPVGDSGKTRRSCKSKSNKRIPKKQKNG